MLAVTNALVIATPAPSTSENDGYYVALTSTLTIMSSILAKSTSNEDFTTLVQRVLQDTTSPYIAQLAPHYKKALTSTPETDDVQDNQNVEDTPEESHDTEQKPTVDAPVDAFNTAAAEPTSESKVIDNTDDSLYLPNTSIYNNCYSLPLLPRPHIHTSSINKNIDRPALRLVPLQGNSKKAKRLSCPTT